MEEKMTYAIFDIDGTLADCEHRRHHVANKPKNWTAFYEAMDADVPNPPVVLLAQALAQAGHKIVCVSGRPSNYHGRTKNWLFKHAVPCWDLYMREEGDHRPDFVVKHEKLQLIRTVHGEPLFAVDDRQQVVDMWRNEGITCFQCARGDF